MQQVVTIIRSNDDAVSLSANGKTVRMKDVEQAVDKAREILSVDPAERDAFNKAATPPEPDEGDQAQPGADARGSRY